MNEVNITDAGILSDKLASFPASRATNLFATQPVIERIAANGARLRINDDYYLLRENRGHFDRLYFALSETFFAKISRADTAETKNLIRTMRKGIEREQTRTVIADQTYRKNPGGTNDVANIVAKILEILGFKPYLVRERMRLKLDTMVIPEHIPDIPEALQLGTASEAMLAHIRDLYIEAFEPYTSCILSKEAMDAAFSPVNYFLLTEKTAVNDAAVSGIAAVLEQHVVGKITYMSHLVVDPKYRGQRLAYIVVRNCLNAAADKGMKRVELWVQADNTAAKKIYSRFGFITDGQVNQSYILENKL